MSSTPPTASNRDELVLNLLVSGGHFFSHFYGLILPPLFAVIAMDLNLNFLEVGLLLSVMALASACTQVPAGIVVDRWGPALPLTLGVTMRAAGICTMGLSHSFEMLMFLAVVSGAGNSVFHPADYSILSKNIRPSRIGRAFSLHTFSGHIGWALAPAYAGWMAGFGSWRDTLIVAGVAGLAMALVLFLYRFRLEGDSFNQPSTTDNRVLRPELGLNQLITTPLIVVFIVFLLDAMAMKGFQTYFAPAIVTTHGATIEAAATLLSLFLAGSAVGVLLGGQLADLSSTHRAIAGASLGGTALLILAMSIHTDIDLLMFALTLSAGICHGLLPPFRDLIVGSLAPRHALGRIFALVSVGFDIGSALAPILFAMALDVGKPNMVFWVAAGCLSVAGLAVSISTNRVTALDEGSKERDTFTQPKADGS